MRTIRNKVCLMSSSDDPRSGGGISFRSLMKLSLPLVVTQLAQVANGFADTVMAGHLGTVSLAAVSAGAALWLPMMIFLIGLLYVLVPVLGHLRGQGRSQAVAETAVLGMVLALLGGVGVGALLFFAGPFLRMIGAAPEIIPEAEAYLRWVAPGMPGAALFVAFRYVLESAGMTGRVTFVALGGAALNAILNYVLMFGAFGVEPLGVAGCGMATALANWACAAAVAVMIGLGPARMDFVAAAIAVWRRGLGRGLAGLLTKGAPVGLSFLSDYLVVAVVAMFIATLGAAQVAGHQIAFNVLTILMMVPLSFAMGGAILLSQARGAGNGKAIASIIRQTMVINGVVGVGLSVLAFLAAPLLPRFYSPDPAIHAATEPLLQVVAALLFLDVVVVSTGSLLRGLGSLSAPLAITAAAHWLISLPLGYAIGMSGFFGTPLGASGWWGAFGVGLLAASLLLSVRLSRVAAFHIKPVPYGEKA